MSSIKKNIVALISDPETIGLKNAKNEVRGTESSSYDRFGTSMISSYTVMTMDET